MLNLGIKPITVDYRSPLLHPLRKWLDEGGTILNEDNEDRIGKDAPN